MSTKSGQPYLYGITAEKEFDPKAFTRASWAPAPPPKPKKEGPLIDFNKHPDSYLVVPYGNTESKPMSLRTKSAIKWIRWVQWILRLIQLVGATGALVLAILIRGMAASTGWIVRVPPGIDIVASTYAAYHLFRPAKNRTPMSSATYHTFAGLTDLGLIPFFVFATILANANLQETQGTNGRWRSIFASVNLSQIIINAAFIVNAAMAGVHFASFGIDVYLVLVFRKIAKLPPDMNPLEDNLTSRPKRNKHKYKDSNATLINPDVYSDKHASIMSDSTLTISHPSPDRTSKASKHNSREPMLPDVDARNISFFHTRNDSDPSFNPHNPRTARMSRAQFDGSERGSMYQQPNSSTASRVNVGSTRELTLAEHRASLLNANTSMTSLQVPPRGASRPQTSHQSARSFVSATSASVEQYDNSPVSPITEDPKSDTWFINSNASKTSVKDFGSEKRPGHRRAKSQYDTAEEAITAQGPPDFDNSGTVRRPRSYQPVRQDSDMDVNKPLPTLKPLAMNPPSPLYPTDANKENEKEVDADTYSIDSGSHYSQPSVTSSSVPNADASSVGRSPGTPKGKYYGDLAAATRGIRGNSPLPTASVVSTDSAAPPPIPLHRQHMSDMEDKKRPLSWFGAGVGSSYGYSGTSSPSPSAKSNGNSKDVPNPNLYSQTRSPYLQTGEFHPSSNASYESSSPSHKRGKSWQEPPKKNTPTRVVSRTGADYEDISMGLGLGSGNRRRDVSGKVAEEGRGGLGWGGFGGPGGWGLRGRKTSAGVA